MTHNHCNNNMKKTELHLTSYRWVMLALLWLLYCCFGIVNRACAPLVTPMLKDLNMSFGQMGFVLGSWQLTYIVIAFFAGLILDKWGIRKSLFLGIFIISLSSILRFFAAGFVTLLIFVALFGLGGPMISIGAPKTISVWFKGKNRATAVGIYTTGSRIGSMFSLAATNGIVMPLTGYSWRLTFVFYGVLALGVGLLWWILAKDSEPAGVSEKYNMNKVFFRLIHAPNVRIILLAGLLTFVVNHGFAGWLPKMLETKGMPPSAAGVVASTTLLASIPAVLIIPRMIPHYLRGRLIALLALSTSAGIMLVTRSGVSMIVGLLLYGFTGSIVMPLLMLTLMEIPEVGSEYMGSAGGLFFCVAEIGGVLGPLIMGFLVDLTGTFLTGVSFLAVLGFAISALTFLLKLDTRITPIR